MITVERLDTMQGLQSLSNESVDLIVCDPPYSDMNNHLKLGKGRIVGDYKTKDDWFQEWSTTPEAFCTFLAECARVLRPDRHFYLMMDSFSLLELGGLVKNYFNVKGIIVWDKTRIGMGHYYRRQHELIIFASKGKRPINSHALSDIWKIPRVTKPVYPTQKPVELFSRMLEGSAQPGYTILDPFAGSFGSMEAAYLAGCHYIGWDISSDAIESAKKRLASIEST